MSMERQIMECQRRLEALEQVPKELIRIRARRSQIGRLVLRKKKGSDDLVIEYFALSYIEEMMKPSPFLLLPSRSIWEFIEKCIQHIHRKVSLWLQLIYLVAFFFHFSEFPNGVRHSCTTMPWTIIPSLAVLWGVCWMFYPSESGNFSSPDDLLHGKLLSSVFKLHP